MINLCVDVFHEQISRLEQLSHECQLVLASTDMTVFGKEIKHEV